MERLLTISPFHRVIDTISRACRNELTAAERQQLLEGWNPAYPTDESNECVHELFAEQAARTPTAVASRRAGVALRAMIVAAYARALQKYLKQEADPLHALGLFWNLVPVCIRDAAAGEGLPEQHVQRLLSEIEPFASYPLTQIAGLRGVDELFFATLNFTNFHNRFRRDVAEDMRIVPLGAHDRFHYPLNYHLAVRWQVPCGTCDRHSPVPKCTLSR